MRYDSCQKMFDLYVENPDKISMIVMFDENDKVMGRSLLWEFDNNKIMDRIYTINDEQLTFFFKKWATENGYYFRSQQNWYNSLQFERLRGDKKILKFDIKLDNFDFRYYPYMDTFKFFNQDTGTFSNYRPEGTDHYTLCSSDGNKYGYDYLQYDDIDEYYRHRGDVVAVQYMNIHTHPNRCNYSEIHDQYILSEHSEWNEDIRDYIFTGDYEHLNDKSSIEERIKNNKERDIRNSKRTISSYLEEVHRISMNYFNNIQIDNIQIETN
jgi:hypothetical protein